VFIDFFAKIGWATDLKTVSDDLIRKRIIRTGPSTTPSTTVSNSVRESFKLDTSSSVWGWDDPSNSEEDKNLALILKKSHSTEGTQRG
jgi:stearoyl-CoA desaturase (Delta-9 desaturase)